MINSKMYFDVVINGNTYKIIETKVKPQKKGCAIATLQKIERVLKDNLTFSPDSANNSYVNFTKNELETTLIQQSYKIQKDYNKKQSKLFWIIRKIFSQKKLVAVYIERIRMLGFQMMESLPPELTAHVAKFLPVSIPLAQVSKQLSEFSKYAKLEKAREYGYKGQSCDEAVTYLKILFANLRLLCKSEIIPNIFHSYKGDGLEIDEEKTLENLKNLTTENLFYLFKDSKIYSAPHLSKFLLIIKDYWTISDCLTEDIKIAGSEALYTAANFGEKNIVEFLLHHKADPNVLTNEKDTPLHLAVMANKIDIVELLLKYGANPNIPDQNGDYLLSLAVNSGNSAMGEMLLKNGANPYIDVKHIIDEKTEIDTVEYGITHLLTEAVKREDTPIVELLLRYSDAPYVTDQTKIELLHHAVGKEALPIVKLLLDHGTPVNKLIKWKSALLLACEITHPNPEIVKLLLEHGANTNISTKKIPLLHQLILKGHDQIVELFLEKRPATCVNAVDITTIHSALKIAYQTKNIQIFNRLFEVSPKIALKICKGISDLATQERATDFVVLLREKLKKK